MIGLWISLFISMSSAQECRTSALTRDSFASDLTCALAKEQIISFFKDADPCVGKELLSYEIYGPLCQTELRSVEIPILNSVQQMETLAGEIIRPMRTNKLYRNFLNRPEFAQFLKNLAAGGTFYFCKSSIVCVLTHVTHSM